MYLVLFSLCKALYLIHSSQHSLPPTKNGIKSQLLPQPFCSPQRNEKKSPPPSFHLSPHLDFEINPPPPWCFQNYFHLKNVSNDGNIDFWFSTHCLLIWARKAYGIYKNQQNPFLLNSHAVTEKNCSNLYRKNYKKGELLK